MDSGSIYLLATMLALMVGAVIAWVILVARVTQTLQASKATDVLTPSQALDARSAARRGNLIEAMGGLFIAPCALLLVVAFVTYKTNQVASQSPFRLDPGLISSPLAIALGVLGILAFAVAIGFWVAAKAQIEDDEVEVHWDRVLTWVNVAGSLFVVAGVLLGVLVFTQVTHPKQR